MVNPWKDIDFIYERSPIGKNYRRFLDTINGFADKVQAINLTRTVKTKVKVLFIYTCQLLREKRLELQQSNELCKSFDNSSK